MANYIMPPRLYASDYAKGKITQDEIIAIQIANDANIAKARKSLKMGELPQKTLEQEKSPDELLMDIEKQEADARKNLERLGFRPQESAIIITTIRSDPELDFISLNTNFPAIETDIKKRFNVKLLTPTFFLEYFRKYTNELDGVTGMKVFDTGVNGLVNTVSELKQILLSREEFRSLLSRVKNISLRTQKSLELLQNSLPSQVDYDRIEQLNAVERDRVIQSILTATETLPSKEEIENIFRQGKVDELANSIPAGLDRKLDNILNDVREVGTSQTEILRKQEQILNKATRKQKVEWEGSIIDNLDDFDDLLVGDKRKFLSSRVDFEGVFLNGKKLTPMEIAKVKKDELPELFLQWLTRYESTLKPSRFQEENVSTTSAKAPSGISNITPSGVEGLFRTPDESPIKKGVGLKKLKMKVGKGLSVKQTPSYREYGKYAIHIPQLEQQDILNVKYKSLGQVPKFKPIPVSDIFRDFILDLLENGKPNVRVYSQIAPDERKFFEEMSIGAGVWNSLGLKRTTTSSDEEENKRFEILRGEYIAGNNNPKVASELRRLVIKMMNDGRIRKNQGIDLLMELA